MNRWVPPYTRAVRTEYHGGAKQICNKLESVDRTAECAKACGVRVNEAAIRSHLIPSTALIANEETPAGPGISPGWAFGPQELT
jgi:hypothetical protein